MGRATCRPTSHDLLMAVGILSHPLHHTWSNTLVSTLIADSNTTRVCVVMRANTTRFDGRNTLHVQCPELGRQTGPLCSIVRWYEQAITAFPRARFVGKADDDAVWHPERVATSLRSTVGDHVFWGMHERYYWNDTIMRAIGFAYGPSKTPCRRRTGFIGPFTFAKGPLFFLSRSIVESIVRNPQTLSHAEHIWRHRWPTTPWEDVWVGMSALLANLTTLQVHHIDIGPFAEQWGWYVAPSTIVWHMKTKLEGRIAPTYAYMDAASRRSCDRGRWDVVHRHDERVCASTNVTVFKYRLQDADPCKQMVDLKKTPPTFDPA